MKRIWLRVMIGFGLVGAYSPIASQVAVAQEVPVPALGAFGDGLTYPARAALKPVASKSVDIPCLAPENAERWMVENGTADVAQPVFKVEESEGKRVLRLAAGLLTPGRSTVRILLPGDGPANGDVWSKNKADHISFLCKSNLPVQLTFHLLQRGKTAGTYQTGFSVKPGEWQRVILPVSQFDLKGFGRVAGLGVRVAAADKNAEVLLTDFKAGGVAYNDDSWKSRRLSISINGIWRFATDPGEQGMNEKWFADKFDDAQWKTLESGKSWQEQGIVHYGWGWYRQKLVLPKEAAGMPVTLALNSIPTDDEVWVNGVRVGGFNSEYKYRNWLPRAYVVPASVLRYGEANTIVVRVWGGNLSFTGDKSGLTKGLLCANIDPYGVWMREPGKDAVPAEAFDLSDAQRGKPFEVLFRLPPEVAKDNKLRYKLADPIGTEIAAGVADFAPEPVGAGGPSEAAQASVTLQGETAQKAYLAGRLSVTLVVENAAGAPSYIGVRDLDRLLFLKRDHSALPELAAKEEDTPYGRLRLIDEIDCATPTLQEEHPYMQSGYESSFNYMTPGAPADVRVREILGKPARESGYGWFAYRLGRGKLKPRSTYLVRIEYPEDKPRIAPIEYQSGQNFYDAGWKNGVGADDVYDNWPLNHQWNWYDMIVPLDDQTVGTGGAGTAPAENGFWMYFMNKQKPGMYYAMWEGGPAVARIKLYEINAEKHAPVIRRPQGLPERVLGFDWERQADHDPQDLARYAKLMGYNAISPVMLKWFFDNYADPLNGYTTVRIDAHDYWAKIKYDPASGVPAMSPIPSLKSQHLRYLEATKQWGLRYIPRVEYGGSQDLPKEAWAVDANGQPTKPNRFAPWCANLLHPAVWDDLQKYVDNLFKTYAADNPQLTGMLWRIRCARMPISYGKADLELFAKETGTALPAGGDQQRAIWATTEGRSQYDAWWHQKRTDFHIRLVKLLRSYRADMTLYYYNWDEDKFGLIEPDITAWGFVANVVKPAPEGGRAAYEKERQVRKGFTAADYIAVMRSGNFGKASKGINRADYGIRPELYKDAPGIELFAPANYLCYADKPEYLNYFRTHDGVAVSNVVSYDEIGARTINPKYEGNMLTPGGAAFSMALELLSYFHSDARTLNYTVYTYGRGFADAHRRFAQAFLALPAIASKMVEHNDPDLRVRLYPSANGTYIGVAYKGYVAKKLTIRVPAEKAGALENLVTGEAVASTFAGGHVQFDIDSGPVELNAFLLR